VAAKAAVRRAAAAGPLRARTLTRRATSGGRAAGVGPTHVGGTPTALARAFGETGGGGVRPGSLGWAG